MTDEKLTLGEKIKNWFIGLFVNEYRLEVWFVDEEYETDGKVKVTKRKRVSYHMKNISKLTNKHVVGKTIDGYKLEIKSMKPFDFEYLKIK